MDSTGFKLFIIACLICVVGILSIYSSTYQKEGQLWKEIYKRQIIWVLFGVCAFFLMSQFHYRRLWDWTYLLYAVALFLLLLVFILGIVRLGAQRWLKFAWFNFQPTELVKLIMVIFLARYFSTKSAENVTLQVGRFGVARAFIIPFILISIPAAFIIDQPDLGSGVLIFCMSLSLLYLAGVRLKYMLVFLFLIAISFPFLWHFLRDYQKDRLLVFLNPNIDPLGAGYTIIQAKIAIGSGGLFGKGWLSGTQSQLHFLPESHTDFIFATFAEERGFLGTVVLLLLYYVLINQGFKIAQRTYDSFGKLLAFGIVSMLGIQVFINVAMNLGFAPIVGVPLPLMSYGGSSVFVVFLALGILANISKSRA